jgi:hypothetical protein
MPAPEICGLPIKRLRGLTRLSRLSACRKLYLYFKLSHLKRRLSISEPRNLEGRLGEIVLRRATVEDVLPLANLLRGVLHLGLENLVGPAEEILNGGAHRSPLVTPC